ncbi:MAG: hypothetical protein ACOCUO_01785, partial [archaeon]
TIGVAGALGGTAAQQIAGRVLPMVGFDASPSDPSGLVLGGALKMAAAAALGLLAIRVGGTPGLILGVAGVGALVVGGGDWINAVLSTDIGAAAPRRAKNAARSSSPNVRVKSKSTKRRNRASAASNGSSAAKAAAGPGGNNF